MSRAGLGVEGEPLGARAPRGLRFVAWLVAAYVATFRVRVATSPALARESASPWVLALFHGLLVPALAWPRRRALVALVSRSKDGDRLGALLARLGIGAARGSSSRGGAVGLAGLVRALRAGHDVAVAVDGPKGPRRAVKAGALEAARLGGGVLVPLAAAAWPAIRLRAGWDEVLLPLPFARVGIALGAPASLDAPAAVADALAAAERDARALVYPRLRRVE